MSIWSDLLSLHGYTTHTHNDDAEAARMEAAHREEAADRLRELIGCRSPRLPRPEPRRPVLGVRGLA
jgi:Mn-dependent DtxR family transcriptional regulator